MKRKLSLLLWMCVLPALPDEGMWLYRRFPTDAVEHKYGFSPTGQGSFYATAESSETRCAGLEASVLVKIDDVTTQVKTAAREGAAAVKTLEARNAVIARIEKDCAAHSGNTCSVATLLSGGRYDLFQFRKYTDVRLVFAPE
jgi:hypothetical protein